MADDVKKALEAAECGTTTADKVARFLRALPSEVHIEPLSLKWRTVPQDLRCADIRADGARVLWDELAAAVERAAKE